MFFFSFIFLLIFFVSLFSAFVQVVFDYRNVIITQVLGFSLSLSLLNGCWMKCMKDDDVYIVDSTTIEIRRKNSSFTKSGSYSTCETTQKNQQHTKSIYKSNYRWLLQSVDIDEYQSPKNSNKMQKMFFFLRIRRATAPLCLILNTNLLLLNCYESKKF